jgi:hypothetical protein
MKSLIKREGSWEFLKEDGSWTEDVASAWVFPNVSAVYEERRKRDLINVEHYVLQRDQISSLDFSFPIG